MEILEDKIKKFLAIDAGHYYAFGDGSGHGNHYSINNGVGFGDGFGCGNGRGYCNSSGQGDSYGYVYGIKVFNGDAVYMIDDVPTIIKSVRGNIAQGYIVKSDLTLVPCYIVKGNNMFAHGNTLRDAFTSLQEKLYNNSTEEDRIEAFMKKFPDYDVEYDNRDLFAYHHVLTGSCRIGRESFVADKGLSLDGKTTVRQFVELTQDAYGGDVIKKLPSAYGIK